MSTYSELAATAQELIDEYGQSVVLKKLDSSAADASKPWLDVNTSDVTATVKGVLLDYNERDVDGDLVRRGDMRAYVAHLTTDYRDYDQLTDAEGRVFKIINVSLLNPGGTKLLYDMQLRK